VQAPGNHKDDMDSEQTGLEATSSNKSYPCPLVVTEKEHFVHDKPGTCPRLCRLSDGSILVGFKAVEPDGQCVLSIARSTDNARTFQAHGEVTRSFGDCDNLVLLELRPLQRPDDDTESNRDTSSPVILAAFRNHDLSENGTPTWFRITVCQSTDGGQTWAFLSHAFEKDGPFGLSDPFLRNARVGNPHVQLYFSQEMDRDDQNVMLVRSTDGGETWSPPVCVAGADEIMRDGMVGVAEARDMLNGSEALVMVMETTRLGTHILEASVSKDDGETWEPRQPVYETKEGISARGPQITGFPNGSVAVVFMTDEDQNGEPPNWPRGVRVKAIFGTPPYDSSLRWSNAVVVAEAPSSNPGIISMADDAVLAVYESSSIVRGRMLKTSG
jgi:hypothetical protein